MNILKKKLKRIYFALMMPLYKRLSREITLDYQKMLQELLASEERFSVTYRRELVSLSARFQQLEERLQLQDVDKYTTLESDATDELIDRQIADIVAHIDQSNDLVKVSHTFGVPLEDVLTYEKKYRGMNAMGVQRARRLEKEIAELRRKTD